MWRDRSKNRFFVQNKKEIGMYPIQNMRRWRMLKMGGGETWGLILPTCVCAAIVGANSLVLNINFNNIFNPYFIYLSLKYTQILCCIICTMSQKSSYKSVGVIVTFRDLKTVHKCWWNRPLVVVGVAQILILAQIFTVAMMSGNSCVIEWNFWAVEQYFHSLTDFECICSWLLSYVVAHRFHFHLIWWFEISNNNGVISL